MPNYDLQRKIVDLPLFRPPDHHQIIWESLSKQQMAQVTKLVSGMLLEYQKHQGGNKNERED